MKARFIGDPNDNYSGPDVFPLRGVTFLKDKWTSVADEALFAKLQTHNHFETADAGFVSIEPEAAFTGIPFEESSAAGVTVPMIERMSLEDAPAEPVTDEKASLIAQLEAIPGAEFDGRWGVPKLRQALEAARFMAGDEE